LSGASAIRCRRRAVPQPAGRPRFRGTHRGGRVESQPAMAGSQPTYTQEEVNEILRRALSQEARRETVLSHDDLVEIATEAGIDRLSLDQAMADLAQEHMRELARKGEAAEIAAERKVQLKRFLASLVTHGALNGFLYLAATRLTGGTWYVWPLLASGIVLTLKLRHVLFPYDKVLRRRKGEARQRERERRAALRAEWSKRILGASSTLAEGGKGFEAVVEKGVAALVAIAERKLDEHKSRDKASSRRPQDKGSG
jgi:hypothetical protein